MNPRKLRIAQLHAENKKWPDKLAPVPPAQWLPRFGDRQCRIAVWRSREFLVQVVAEDDKSIRLTVNRTMQDGHGQWIEGITWDELMEVKRQAGYGDRLAVEFYPEDKDIVNVGNMRHLWIPFGNTMPQHWNKDHR